MLSTQTVALIMAFHTASYGAPVLTPADYQSVTLDGGRLRAQTEEVREYYLAIPNDDLLKGFRQRAGRPAPGADLGGWYSADVFHIFGQVLSGLSRLYAATGDEACREKAVALMEGWAECISPDGWFYYSNTPNAPHYTYDKMVGGLVDVYHYCHDARALEHLSRITDWAIANLDRERLYAFTSGDGNTEWYTLSENLYRAYQATGHPKYRFFAEVWEYIEYWDVYGRGDDILAARPSGGQTTVYHAYSHVNALSGLGAAYAAKGDPWYLNALRNAYDYLMARQAYATGGYGPNEQLLPRAQLVERLGESHAHFETQCGSWAAFKMCKYLTSLTGEARYGDWVERLMHNGIGASIPMGPRGEVFYFSDYNAGGGEKRNASSGWTCCAGTRPSAIADYADLIYFLRGRDLYVSQFVPSTVTVGDGGSKVTIRQRTRFPEEDSTELRISAGRPQRFALHLRRPSWLAGPMTASLNGRPIALAELASGWMQVERTWSEGDDLRVRLPMELTTSAMSADGEGPRAILYGPVVLAARGADSDPHRAIDLERVCDQFLPVSGEPLTFRHVDDPNVALRPFYAYKEGEPYVMYLDPLWAGRVSHSRAIYSPGWGDSGAFHFTPQVGATVEFTFESDGVRWLGYRFDDAGMARVEIDGREVAVVDQYGPGRQLPFDWRVTGLGEGSHTLRLTVLPERNDASVGTFINVAGFQVLPAE